MLSVYRNVFDVFAGYDNKNIMTGISNPRDKFFNGRNGAFCKGLEHRPNRAAGVSKELKAGLI